MSSVITIGFSGRTRACIRTEFSPPIADDERREMLIHVALLTARTFAALDPETQLTFAGTLREWIEDRFVACPTRLIPGDPMACLPRFASSFVAPVREYALASKGCNHNGRGVAFFLPMALVSFLHHVAERYVNPDDLLKPAVALCAAVVIQPMTMENHFQAAAASLPKVGPIIGKAWEEEQVVTEEVVPSPSVAKKRIVMPIRREPAVGQRRERRRALVLSACLAALVIIAGVQYLSVHERQTVPPSRDIVSLPPPVPIPSPTPTLPSPPPRDLQPELPKVPGPLPTAPSGGDAAQSSASKETSGPIAIIEPPAPSPIPPLAPSPVPPPAPPAVAPLSQSPVSPPIPAPIIEQPGPVMAQAGDNSSSKAIRVYQEQVRELAEDAMAQVVVMVNAIEGQVLTQFELKDVLAYGLRQTKAGLNRLQRLRPPDMYKERQREIIQAVMDLELLGRELSLARMQPPEGVLQERLAGIQGRLEESLHAVDNL